MPHRTIVPTLLALQAAAALAHAQGPLLRAQLIAENLNSPLFLTAPPGDTSRVFIVEYLARVRILDLNTGQVLAAPFLDITPQVAGNGGLLGMAFDPDFASTRHIYLYWIALSGDSVIARYTASPANPNLAEPNSEHIVWRFARPFGHHGGWLTFGPDEHLWLSSGDGGHFNNIVMNAQDLTNLYGKLLRIDPRADDFPADTSRNYRIPPDNPDLGPTARPEIWSYGLRNAFRAGFDRQTGELYLGDVGHNDREELNISPPPITADPGGHNYGWPCREGFYCTGYGGCACPSAALTDPILDYPRTLGRCITGGYIYRGSAIPGLQGTYLFADFEDHKVFSLYPTRNSAGVITGTAGFRERTSEINAGSPALPITQPVSFGEDAAGELYLLSFNTGKVYRIAAATGPAACYPNCDASTISPTLNVADFTCFLQRFAAQDPYANCDQSALAHTLNVADFTCFLQRFAAGCP